MRRREGRRMEGCGRRCGRFSKVLKLRSWRGRRLVDVEGRGQADGRLWKVMEAYRVEVGEGVDYGDAPVPKAPYEELRMERDQRRSWEVIRGDERSSEIIIP